MEGILLRAADELQALQEERKVHIQVLHSFFGAMLYLEIYIYLISCWIFQRVDPQTAEAIDQFLLKLRACATGDSSFTFVLDDPSGNSFIENL